MIELVFESKKSPGLIFCLLSRVLMIGSSKGLDERGDVAAGAEGFGKKAFC